MQDPIVKLIMNLAGPNVLAVSFGILRKLERISTDKIQGKWR
jgi:hypothetical protein